MAEKELKIIDAEVVVTPMTLIKSAQEKDASIEQMQQLFDLQLRWEDNEAKKAFNVAIADFKKEAVVITKDKSVGYTNKDGSFTGYSHASLGNVIGTITPFLSGHGLSISWDTLQTEGDISVTCCLTHELGHSTSTTMTAKKDDSGKKNPIQQLASTVAYLQRYTALSITGLATEDQDDDGKGADPDPVDVIDDEQYANLDALMDEVKANRKGFLTAYKITSLELLPATMYNHACKSLEAKRK